MWRRVGFAGLAFAGLAILLRSGAVFAASAPPVEDEWKQVKAADSPVVYARFLEAHPDFEKAPDLLKRLKAANRRAAGGGRQVEITMTRYESAESPAREQAGVAGVAYVGEVTGMVGRDRVLLDLVFEGGGMQGLLVPGVQGEQGRGSWAVFFAQADSAGARERGERSGNTRPILAIVWGLDRALPPAELYLGGTPAVRLIVAKSERGSVTSSAGSSDSTLAFDEPPVSIKIFAPEYPPEARQARMEGLVLVEVIVSETGRVVHAEVIRSDTVPMLESASVRAALLSLFRPALHAGVPVRARVVLPFRFKLN